MTVQEASYLLIGWFKYNDYFDLESNYTSVIKGKNLHKDPVLIRSYGMCFKFRNGGDHRPS